MLTILDSIKIVIILYFHRFARGYHHSKNRLHLYMVVDTNQNHFGFENVSSRFFIDLYSFEGSSK